MDKTRHLPAWTSPNKNSDELEEADYVNMARRTVGKPPHNLGKKYLNHLSIITICWGTLLLVMVPRIYFTSVLSENYSQLMTENRRLILKIQELQANNTLQSQNENLRRDLNNLTVIINQNLTQENHQLQSQNEHLRRDLNNLTVIIGNVTEASALLERTVTTLTAEKEQLSSKNQELQDKIETLGVVKVSMTQSIIDAYCPKPTEGDRRCGVCADGWLRSQSSCYAINDAEPKDRRSWEDAEKDCRSKGSHLAVIDNDTEKDFISKNSFDNLNYWIGLEVVDGRWKWLNGTSLSQNSWIGPPQNGHCATSFHDGVLRAAWCTEKSAWICEKKALTL